MTKLKIKEAVSKGNSIDSEYPFEDIGAGDMFYNYNMDWLIVAIEYHSGRFILANLTTGECEEKLEEVEEYFEDVFERLTEEYGDWYPVSKAKLKFTVGE